MGIKFEAFFGVQEIFNFLLFAGREVGEIVKQAPRNTKRTIAAVPYKTMYLYMYCMMYINIYV